MKALVKILKDLQWDVVISDLFPPESPSAKVATELGATYIRSDFDFKPEFEPLLSIDSSGDPASTMAALSCTPQHGRVLVWPEAMPSPSNDRVKELKVPNNPLLEEAIRIIQEQPDELLENLIAHKVPLEEFDCALFPRVPSRTIVVEID